MPPPEQNVVIVGIGEYHIGKGPMSSIGLGSCVGLVIHDRDRAIGGMAHIMLPDSQGRTDRPAKFADTAADLLIKELNLKGCKTPSLVAKITGGAMMFKTFSGNLNIGERNVDSIKSILKSKKIPLQAEDVGGTTGRTIVYYPAENGKITIKVANGTIKII